MKEELKKNMAGEIASGSVCLFRKTWRLKISIRIGLAGLLEGIMNQIQEWIERIEG